MINPAKLFQLKSSWDRFTNNHPKFPKFLEAAYRNSIDEGTVIEIKITRADGQAVAGNIKVTAEDLELFQEVSELVKQQQ